MPIYFEVPNAGWMLDAVSMWDVIYEHVGYWTAAAIETLFRRAGFDPVSVTTGYGDQFLMVEARPGAAEDAVAEPTVSRLKASDVVALSTEFAQAFQSGLKDWMRRLAPYRQGIVIWGAGSKGVTFANVLHAMGQPIDALVDLNPRKHGRFIAGAGLPVIAPERLSEFGPDLILISNGLYEDEIMAEVREMGLAPDFAQISGISRDGP